MDFTKTEEAPVNILHFPATELNQYEEHEEDSTVSSETGSNDEFSSSDQTSSLANELKLKELLKDDKAYELIYRHCQSNMTSEFEIVSILKNEFQSPLGQAKLKAFQLYTESVAKKNGGCCECGGNKAAAATVSAARVRYGWCCVEKEDLKAIMMYGFSNNNGLRLSPDDAPLQCLKDSSEHGIRFLLLSRVILGKSEIVFPQDSITQSHPSSSEFDSGVDSLISPKKYIIWSTHMNTHVLPEFVVCIRRTSSILKTTKPKSPWISFPVLIKSISKFLNPSQIRLIHKQYKEQQDRRISRSELIQRLRGITGDRLLVHIIKSFGQKAREGPRPINVESRRG